MTGNASPNEYRKWYKTYKWQKRRAAYLTRNPLCVFCEAEGRATIATVVDHIIPHKGDVSLFWEEVNFQSLCKPHHDVTKRAQEAGKVFYGLDGYPIE